jgi:signal transduction histidine kinase
MVATYAAPPERLAPLLVDAAVTRFSDLGMLQSVLDMMPECVIILNGERQILFGNQATRRLATELGRAEFAGLRLGELLSCRNLTSAPSGCGTSKGCRTCGALHASLMALHGRELTTECLVTAQDGQSYELKITASPFAWHGEEYALLMLGDISAEKRREMLERVFFHDVLNTAGGVSGLLSVVADDPSLYPAMKDDLVTSSEMLVNEIKSQQQILSAESGKLVTQPEVLTADRLLQEVRQVYHHHPVADGKVIELELDGATFELTSDHSLLQRVLGNMLKNALEASKRGATVRLGAARAGSGCEFWCRNEGVIPEDIQRQLFQRSFSTKGSGRGIGTYSIKLFGEQYLGGRVGFTSTAESGTRFFIWLPMG